MSERSPTVVIFEDNATRADLYELWLVECEVRIALTERDVEAVVDDSVAVAVFAEEFGDESAGAVVEYVRSQSPFCQVVTTSRDRRQVCPQLDVDTHMTKPVFEDDLRETVERLAAKALYGRTLVKYYQLAGQLTMTEVAPDRSDKERAALERRVERVREVLATCSATLEPEDRQDIVHDIAQRHEASDNDEEQIKSKYVPDKCHGCGTGWSPSGDDDRWSSYKRLGSFVWRCTECGRVQMQADPSHQQTVR